MKKILFLVTLAVALCAPAYAQQKGDDWEQSSQVQIKCVRGHVNCTLTHQDDSGDGGIVDLGSNSGGNTGTSDTITDDERPTKGNSRVGGDDDTISDTDQGNKSGGETEIEKAERLAREECERVERSNRRIEAAKSSGNEEELQRATAELTRAQNKMQIEMDRKLAGVRRAATGSSAKLSKAIAELKVWQDAMVKVGLTKEVAQWYVTNKPEIEQLLVAFGDSKKPGPLRWLAANQKAIESMKDDYDQLRTFYSEWTDKDGNSHEPLMATAVRLDQEATRNNNQDKEISNLWSSVGSEWWVKLLAILGPVLAILAFVLRKK